MRSALRGLVRAFGTLLLAASLAFFALRTVPGDAITAQLRESGASDQMIAERRASLGLDLPMLAQYGTYLLGLLRADLGVSLLDGRSITEIIGEQAPATISLAGSALLVAIVLGIILGGSAALPGAVRGPARTVIAIGLSTPIYVTGMIAIMIFATWLGWLPGSGAGRLEQLLLPATVLGFHTAAPIAQVVQAALSRTLGESFIVTARGKGLPSHSILIGHALRAAMPPIIAVIGLEAGFLLGGTVITETVFSRPGIGRILIDASLRQDYPVVQGAVLWSTLSYIALSSIGDMIASLVDPRLRDEG
ncbi:MAG: ABC transporter permease [Anaerolineae bacterium]|nr:ABC transporter permease [Anaerolineae bacterium]NUQ02469.1 ABC transporter permease [Anaerolineae bacterium]